MTGPSAKRIAEWNTEFDHIRAGVDGRERNGARGVERGIAGRQIDDQAGFVIEAYRHRSLRSHSLKLQLAGQNAHILVAASREVHHQYVTGRERGSKAQSLGHGVRAFERGQNSFGPRELDDCIESGGIVLRDILGAAGVVQRGVLGADGGVVEAGGNGVRERDLAVVILQNVGESSLQNAGRAALGSGPRARPAPCRGRRLLRR